jgi:hypothetical protein
MDHERKVVVRAEIIMPRLAADRLGFESIPHLLMGNFFVDGASRAATELAWRESAEPCACNDCSS